MPEQVDNKVYQEFYCRKSGGGCGGYIAVKINIALDGSVKVICPKCKHEHERSFKGGRIVDERKGGAIVQELIPTLAAWSENSRLNPDKQKKEQKDLEDGHAVIYDQTLRDSWFEKFGGKK